MGGLFHFKQALRSNYGALGVKQTSTHDAVSLGSTSLASIPTMCSGNTGT